MGFGVDKKAPVENKKTVKAITAETFVAVVVIAAVFGVFAWRMGLANMFGTMMATAHDLMLNTVLFLMGVIILAGAFTALISEFGIVSIVNRILSPLMKPFFGLPGAASIGVVATYLSTWPINFIPFIFLSTSRRWGQIHFCPKKMYPTPF